MSASQLSRLVELLGGWPDYFCEIAEAHGESILAVLMARKTIDQAVFGLVVRYAVHRAAFDTISAEIAGDDADPDKITETNYLSGHEQRRAFHENKCAILERELLATPFARAKAGEKIQTSFLDLLTEPSGPGDGPEDGGAKKVLPFQAMSKKTYV